MSNITLWYWAIVSLASHTKFFTPISSYDADLYGHNDCPVKWNAYKKQWLQEEVEREKLWFLALDWWS